MNSIIYNPLEEFDSRFKNLHLANKNKFFDHLVERSGVNIEENRKTVKEYNEFKENLSKLKRKLKLWKFLRVLMCITIILIPLVILKTTPKIKALKSNIESVDKRIAELLAQAHNQMATLNSLFTDRDSLKIIEETIPLVSFEPCFTVEQEADMRINYDFSDQENREESTLSVLAGHYNENPFLFENKLVHRMGVETYHGYKTITWTETYRDSSGKLQRRTRSETRCRCRRSRSRHCCSCP